MVQKQLDDASLKKIHCVIAEFYFHHADNMSLCVNVCVCMCQFYHIVYIVFPSDNMSF